MLDLLSFPDESRVWIYTSSREFSEMEIPEIQHHVQAFAREWASHSVQLFATAGIFHNRFLVLVVDESKMGASGCSIDSSVRFIKELGDKYNADFFNRQLYSFLMSDEVCVYDHAELKSAFKNGEIGHHTLFFDTLVKSKGEFQRAWLKPVGSSWLQRLLN